MSLQPVCLKPESTTVFFCYTGQMQKLLECRDGLHTPQILVEKLHARFTCSYSKESFESYKAWTSWIAWGEAGPQKFIDIGRYMVKYSPNANVTLWREALISS